MRADGTLASLPQVALSASREEMLAYFDNGWTLTEVLFSSLVNEEAYLRRPYHQLRHPMIFYYGHPVALYVNKLRVAGLLAGPVRPKLEALFETGVDEMRWDDLHEGQDNIWPSVGEVREYRREVYGIIRNLILTHPLLEPEHLPITQDSPLWALVMGFEHERIHLETSSVLIRELPVECVRRPPEWPDYQGLKERTPAQPQAGRDYPENSRVEMAAREVSLGKPADFTTFGWDNEYGADRRAVRPFAADSRLTSNGEFYVFVASGGYAQEKYWSREGWAWRRFRNVKWPSFWVQDGPAGLHRFRLRTVFEVVDMQWDWPVCVNFHEAQAYAAWKSEQEGGMPLRLPTEAEHVAMRGGEACRANLGLEYGAECPVDAFAANARGFHDVFGNVWQWCEDHFHPLPGAQPHPYYDDFSAPCYDGEHQMILGGSFVSTGDEASEYARFHFRPHFFQHAGFRLVQSRDGNPASDAVRIVRGGNLTYETREMLNRYLHFHWASEEEFHDAVIAGRVSLPALKRLPLRCAELVVEHASQFGAALDLGCAVGRSAFELARRFERVTGVDYSREFVEAAEAIRRDGALPYLRKEQGEENTPLRALADPAIDRSRLRFEQGDAMALPLYLRDFDAVLFANVLCRLPEPAAALARMQGEAALVKPGGVLVMTTPFSWLPEYTPKERWLAGPSDVARHLTEFELIHEEEIPFLIREHRRKYEYIVTLATVWRRKR